MSSNQPPELPPEGVRPEFSQRFGRLLGSVFRKWRRHVDAELREYGFSDATRSPLIALYDRGGGPLRQRDLAIQLGLETSALVRVIALLEKRGLVHCAADDNDRRSKSITLTREGRKWAEFILSKGIEIEQRLLAGLTPDEIAAAKHVLRHIGANIPDG